MQVCLSLYMHIFRPYMHILGLEKIYIDHIYMGAVFICLFACLVDAIYMQMNANACSIAYYINTHKHAIIILTHKKIHNEIQSITQVSV